jgi:hypothetical protein
MQSMKAKLDEAESRVASADKEIAVLQREVDNLNNWKSVYESGHGFQELARYQTRLKEDNKRLVLALEQATDRNGEIMDACAVLNQAFDKLKLENGYDPDFSYPEYELREEMLGENARQRSQINELEEQIGSLENDCIRLRKALKNQAGAIGEQGFKYQGMSPEMLVKVNEFATNLREGRVELPLDDRSAELLKENKKLKEDLKLITLKAEKYERDLIAGGGSAAGAFSRNAAVDEAELRGVRDDLHRLLSENADLKHQLSNMQDELMLHLTFRNSGPATTQQVVIRASAGGGGAGDATEALVRSQTEIMHQLQELRASQMRAVQQQQQQQLPPTGRGGRPVPSAQDASRAIDSSNRDSHSASKPLPQHQQAESGTPLRAKPVSVSTAAPSPVAAPPTQQGAHWAPQAQMTTSGYPADYRGYAPAGPGTPMYIAPFSARGTPGGDGGIAGGAAFMMGTPSTPHGKQLLSKTLMNLKLPPEEWADEVKELNAQLIESLEQLYEREAELYESKNIIASLEESLVHVKHQASILYFDYATKSTNWEKTEAVLRRELKEVAADRDDTRLKLKRSQETVTLMQREDPSELEAKLREYSKKLAILEVNEVVLSRRYTALSEQLEEEQIKRRGLEVDFCEMEGTLKKRVLFLENFKARAGRELGQLQSQLDKSVPQSDYFALQTELECLREDHLAALKRELQARLSALKAEDEVREMGHLKLRLADLEAALVQAKEHRIKLVAELKHQTETASSAIQAAASGGNADSAKEMGKLITEMANFRGEAARLEVELAAAVQVSKLLREQLLDANQQIAAVKADLKENLTELDRAHASEQACRKECVAVRLKFDGGMTQAEAEEIRESLRKAVAERDEAVAEALKQTEIAEIASQQTSSMASFRDNYTDELKELRAHVLKLESRSDDDLLIGRMQRQLMSTKSSYKAFARKYQLLRASLRQRDIATRVLETRLDNREQAAVLMQNTHRTEIAAMKKAIRHLCNIAEDDAIGAAGGHPADPSVDRVLSDAIPAPIGQFSRANSSGKEKSGGHLSIGQRLLGLSDKIQQLWSQANESRLRTEAAEKRCAECEAAVEDITADRDAMTRQCDDLNKVLLTTTTKGQKQQQMTRAVALRIASLTDEIRTTKRFNLQQKRDISALKSENKHLRSLLSKYEDDVRVLERYKVDDETNNLLGDMVVSKPGDKASQSSGRGGDGGNGLDVQEQMVEDFVRMRNELFRIGDDDNADIAAYPIEANVPKKANVSNFPGKAGEEVIMENDEYIRKLDEANKMYRDSQREISSLKSRLDAAQGRLEEARQIIEERDEQLAYCEGVLSKANLPSFRVTSGNGRVADRSEMSAKQLRVMKDEQDQMQEAASATISSLKRLLDDKNVTIEKYRTKIADLQEQLMLIGAHRPVSNVDRRADDLLRRLQAEEDRGGVYQGRAEDTPADSGGAAAALNNDKLLDRLDEADAIILEKDRTIAQIEQRLAAQENQRERAEARCAAALQEMDAMKSDLVLMAQQLQQSERRVLKLQQQHFDEPSDKPTEKPEKVRASKDVPASKVSELNKAIKARDEKLKTYRAIILRLKEEFLKSEEDRAIKDATNRASGTHGHRSGSEGAGHTAAVAGPEMDELRSQVSALRDGLRQAKEDLEQARKAREKLLKAKQATEAEAEKFESQVCCDDLVFSKCQITSF